MAYIPYLSAVSSVRSVLFSPSLHFMNGPKGRLFNGKNKPWDHVSALAISALQLLRASGAVGCRMAAVPFQCPGLSQKHAVTSGAWVPCLLSSVPSHIYRFFPQFFFSQ